MILAYGAPPLFALVIMGVVQISYALSMLASLVALNNRLTGRSSSTASKVSLGSGMLPLLCLLLASFMPLSGDLFLDPIVLSLAALLAVAMATSFYFLRLDRNRAQIAENTLANKASHSSPDRAESK